MRCAIAIDFGGTNIRGTIINDKGKKEKKIQEIIVPTEGIRGKDRVISNLLGVIQTLRTQFTQKIEGVGISMPGFVDPSGKVIFGGGTLKCLVGTKLKTIIEKKTKLHVSIDNDANCFAMAEATFGAGKKYSNVVGVIWGTGIGGGIVINRKVYQGSIGGAGEFGHMVVDPAAIGEKCGCGQSGCLEMKASGKNIVLEYLKHGGKIENPHAGLIYKSKEKVAKEVMKNAIKYFSLGLSNIVNILNPDIIVLGGGLSKLPKSAYKDITIQVKKYALKTHTKHLKIVKHKISSDAGIYGAAGLVFNA